MLLDIRTIICMIAVSDLLLGIGLAATARRYPQTLRRGASAWAASCIVQSCAWTLLVLRGAIPDALSIAGGNALLVGSLALQFVALRWFKQRDVSLAIPAGLPVATLALFLVFSELIPSYGIRVALNTAAVVALMGLNAYELLGRRGADFSVSHFLTGIGALWCGIVVIVRLVLIVVTDPAPGTGISLFQGIFQDIVFLSLYVGSVVLTFGFVLMSNDKFNAELERLATLDPLTEVFNRRTLEHLASGAIDSARRARATVSLIMFDLDHFKQVNDLHGHFVGDQVLKTVVAAVQNLLRQGDLFGRYGGEEFVVILPNTDDEHALVVAERLRRAIESVAFVSAGGRVPLTASFGVATTRGEYSYELLLGDADAAMYEAKSGGRNRSVSAGNATPGNEAVAVRETKV